MKYDKLALLLLALLSFLGGGVAFSIGEWLVGVLFAVLALGVASVLGARAVVWLRARKHACAPHPFVTRLAALGWNFFPKKNYTAEKMGAATLKETKRAFSPKLRLQLRSIVNAGAKILFFWVMLSVFTSGLITFRYDWSELQLYSLSSRTQALLRTLEEDVTILFFSVKTSWNGVNELLNAYAEASPRFNYRWIDMTAAADMVRQYDIRNEETLVFYKNSAPEVVFKAFKEDLTPRARTYNYEGVINETLLTLQSSRRRARCYWLTDATGEIQLSSAETNGYALIKSNLERLGYVVEPILAADWQKRTQTLTVEKGDIFYLAETALMTLPPAALEELSGKAASVPDKSLLFAYSQAGAGIVLVADGADSTTEKLSSQAPPTAPQRSVILAPLYQFFGMTAPEGIVVDIENFHPILGQRLYATRGRLLTDFPYIAYAAEHPITTSLMAERLTPFLLTPHVLAPLRAASTKKWEAVALLETSPRAWRELNYRAEIATHGNPRYHFTIDQEGVHKTAWAFANITTGGRAVFLGDDVFFENNLIGLFGNRDFVLNAFLWAGGSDALLGASYKKQRNPAFLPTERALGEFIGIFIIGYPVVLFLLAILLYRIRRRALTSFTL